MVRHQPREFERFLTRVRRRFVVLRLLERVGLGMLFACAAATPLLLIALWLGRPAWPLAPAALLVGALAGLVWGILARPTALDAAMEADRQLGWADLLGSALAVDGRSSDPWAAAVQSAADERCRATRARSVILNRLGARAWGGIGLAGALVLVLALVPTYSTPSQAEEDGQLSTAALQAEGAQQPPPTISSVAQRRRTVPQQEPEDTNRVTSGADPAEPDHSRADHLQRAQATPPHSAGQADSQARGGGESHTDVKNAGALPDSGHARGAPSEDAAGEPNAGSGRGSKSPAASAGQQTGTVSQDSAASPTPPWASPDWPAQVKRAHQAMESGEIPDAYRDVLRGYFDRP